MGPLVIVAKDANRSNRCMIFMGKPFALTVAEKS